MLAEPTPEMTAPFETSQHELQAWQERMKLSMRAAADLLNAPYDTYRNWWYGHRGVPTPVALLMRYVEIYGPLSRERVDQVRRALEFYERHGKTIADQEAALRELHAIREKLERAREAIGNGMPAALTPQCRRLLAVLIEARLFGNDPCEEAVAIGTPSLAERSGIAESTVRRCIARIEGAGFPWLRVVPGSKKDGTPAVYHLDVNAFLEAEG